MWCPVMTKFCNNIIPLPDTTYCTWNEPFIHFRACIMNVVVAPFLEVVYTQNFALHPYITYGRTHRITFSCCLIKPQLAPVRVTCNMSEDFLKSSSALYIWSIVVASQFTIVVVLGVFQSRHGSAPSNRVKCSLLQEHVWLGFALSPVLVI